MSGHAQEGLACLAVHHFEYTLCYSANLAYLYCVFLLHCQTGNTANGEPAKPRTGSWMYKICPDTAQYAQQTPYCGGLNQGLYGLDKGITYNIQVTTVSCMYFGDNL